MSDTYNGTCRLCETDTDLINGICAECESEFSEKERKTLDCVICHLKAYSTMTHYHASCSAWEYVQDVSKLLGLIFRERGNKA